ncbi:hypothetical protein SAMN05216564_12118 [Halopenitus persicus]|uniref:Uncharacterized protein n=1 Tax=Halopenitus persicus TaxID=1048396 RepID=A0A1H3P986_9EURY|nr:hypothetical protein SAMN05216564_12118 [Halopenitus persicus]
MTSRCESPYGPKLDITLLDDQAQVPTYVLYPADTTDKDVETTWIRFKESDSISLWDNC